MLLSTHFFSKWHCHQSDLHSFPILFLFLIFFNFYFSLETTGRHFCSEDVIPADHISFVSRVNLFHMSFEHVLQKMSGNIENLVKRCLVYFHYSCVFELVFN